MKDKKYSLRSKRAASSITTVPAPLHSAGAITVENQVPLSVIPSVPLFNTSNNTKPNSPTAISLVGPSSATDIKPMSGSTGLCSSVLPFSASNVAEVLPSTSCVVSKPPKRKSAPVVSLLDEDPTEMMEDGCCDPDYDPNGGKPKKRKSKKSKTSGVSADDCCDPEYTPNPVKPRKRKTPKSKTMPISVGDENCCNTNLKPEQVKSDSSSTNVKPKKKPKNDLPSYSSQSYSYAVPSPVPHKLKKPAKPKKEKAPPPEKRLKRIRTSLSASRDRIQRALSQRLYLIKREDIVRDEIGAIRAAFTVLGSTGNVYNVTIGRLVECTCPDHRKGNVCKHIIFVMVRVLKQPRDSTLIIQAALLSTELETIFANVSTTSTASVLAKPEVLAQFGEATPSGDEKEKKDDDRRKPIADEDCGVCFEPLKEAAEAQLDWCRDGCGKSLHKECWNKWRKSGNNTCVYCRTEWKTPAAATPVNIKGGKARLSSEGYVNMGHLQGQDTHRDTSSYYNRWNYRWGNRW